MYMLQNARAGAYHADMLRTQAQRDSAGRVPTQRGLLGRGLARRFRRSH